MTSLDKAELKILSKLNSKADYSPNAWEDTLSFWLQFGVNEMFKVAKEIDLFKKNNDWTGLKFKEKNTSPVTDFEKKIEENISKSIHRLNENVKVCGEELGGSIPDNGYGIAIDSIDGTWAFLSGLASYSSTMAIYHNKIPIMSFVLNNSVGELVVAIKDKGVRLYSSSPYLGTIDKVNLPMNFPLKDRNTLAIHAQRSDINLVKKLYQNWNEGETSLVFSVTGSPSWMLSQAAKGCFTYVHSWSKARAKEFDLVPGFMMIKEAGGDIIDLLGNSIDGENHLGLFIAGIDKIFLNDIKDLLEKN